MMARIEELRKENENATNWGGAIAARHEEIRDLNTLLRKTQRRIYLASSWRNEIYPEVLTGLLNLGHQVYDFKAGADAFRWDQIDPNWRNWTADQYRLALIHPLAKKGYAADMSAMEWADTCVLVLPCGRSAHLEAGWFAGKGKSLYILTRDGEEPELMANMATFIVGSQDELYRRLD